MRRLLTLLVFLLVLAALAAGAIVAVSETGVEVVTIHTSKANGGDAATCLWVVDDDGAAWLRASMGRAAWVNRAEAKGELLMVRNGERRRYKVRVTDDPTSRLRIQTLMAKKYGWHDRFIDVVRDGERSLAVRLDLIEGDVR